MNKLTLNIGILQHFQFEEIFFFSNTDIEESIIMNAMQSSCWKIFFTGEQTIVYKNPIYFLKIDV